MASASACHRIHRLYLLLIRFIPCFVSNHDVLPYLWKPCHDVKTEILHVVLNIGHMSSQLEVSRETNVA